MKQYLLSVHYVEGDAQPEPAVVEQMYADVEAFNKKAQAEGAYVFAGGLLTPDTGSVVRNDNGQVTVTDGPFPEAKEQLGGFWVIRAADDQEARDWAAQASRACQAPVEIRPFQEEPEG